LSVDGDNLLDVYQKTEPKDLGRRLRRIYWYYVLSSGYYDAFYTKAELVRSKMRLELDEVFANVDAIITPTTPTPAFKFGEKNDPLAMYRQDIFTVPVNLTGVPALSFPMGTVERDDVSLPVGVQYIAPHGGDNRLFDIGKRLYDERL
jgi:aspartyl-tRNA(Asn)/glutamyl-tRNA(Gln) amidotransferase subunit A